MQLFLRQALAAENEPCSLKIKQQNEHFPINLALLRYLKYFTIVFFFGPFSLLWYMNWNFGVFLPQPLCLLPG